MLFVSAERCLLLESSLFNVAGLMASCAHAALDTPLHMWRVECIAHMSA